MCTRRETCVKAAAWMAAFAAHARGQGNAQGLRIPFNFASGRGSLVIPARINRRAAQLIVDTGSSHTILRPSVAGVNRSELSPPRAGAGVIGDAVGHEVTLEIGGRVWQRRRVSVMDLSAALSAYQEKIDGLLGMDFLLEFSQAVINLKERLVTFIP
ncbi:MAG TPA: retropepsin-like aspartic protease [Bryobacteraceae bacterium]|nr:retropepsin-like aspartic protease [Bryobacteraceae bacterium]